MLFLAQGPVAFKAKLQRIQALSSAEAEYVALAECAKEALALRSLLGELGYPQESTVLFETTPLLK